MVLCDIFSVPVPFSQDARRKQWREMCASLSRLGLLGACQFPFAELNYLVYAGFLSARSASYFMSGRASSKQIALLEAFIVFKDDMLRTCLSSLKILELWQKQNAVELENTFLFPLAELVSNDVESIDLFKEVSSYDSDYKDLQKLI